MVKSSWHDAKLESFPLLIARMLENIMHTAKGEKQLKLSLS